MQMTKPNAVDFTLRQRTSDTKYKPQSKTRTRTDDEIILEFFKKI